MLYWSIFVSFLFYFFFFYGFSVLYRITRGCIFCIHCVGHAHSFLGEKWRIQGKDNQFILFFAIWRVGVYTVYLLFMVDLLIYCGYGRMIVCLLESVFNFCIFLWCEFCGSCLDVVEKKEDKLADRKKNRIIDRKG